MIIGTVRSREAFRTGEALRLVAADREAGVTETLPAFADQVRRVLLDQYPDCSEGFVEWITQRAWATHTVRRVTMKVTPSMLAVLVTLLDESERGDGLSEAGRALAREVRAAWLRLGRESSTSPQ